MRIVVRKNEYKKEDKHPDYRISGLVGSDWENVGALWLKKGDDGKQYLSGEIKEDASSQEKIFQETAEKPTKDTPQIEYPEGDIDPQDIPF